MMTEGMFTHYFLPGIWITIQVTLYSAALGLVVAFLIGWLRTSRRWLVRFLAGAYFEIFRGMSALILMFWLVFALPVMFRWQLVPMWAAVLALGLTYGAYGSEVVRGALAAVPAAQREAGSRSASPACNGCGASNCPRPGRRCCRRSTTC